MPDTTYMLDIDAMTPAERREYIIRLEFLLELAESAKDEAVREVISLRAEIAGRIEFERESTAHESTALRLLAQLGVKEPCNAFHLEHGRQTCWGTKECDPCSCGGDKTRCTHYPYRGALPEALGRAQ